jgi:hypothetical protein
MSPHRTLLTIFLILACASARAQSVPAPAAETTRLLEQRKYAALDERLSKVQADYARGRIDEIELRAAFRPFYPTDPKRAALLEGWTKKFPNSYVAHLARGIYYRFLGSERRGTAWASDTTQEQFAGMHAAFALALQEFDKSLALEDKPLLTYMHTVDIHMNLGDDLATRAVLDAATRIAPDTFIVREKYIGTLGPEWGGSLRAMRAFLAECKSDGVRATDLHKLEGIVVEWEAREMKDRSDLPGAASAFERAADLHPERAGLEQGPSHNAALLRYELKDYAGAIRNATKMLDVNSSSTAALVVRGISYFALRKGPETYADLLRAANLGSAHAQVQLAKILMLGDVVPRNDTEAEKLLVAAAAQGSLEGKKFLERIRAFNEKYPQPKQDSVGH